MVVKESKMQRYKKQTRFLIKKNVTVLSFAPLFQYIIAKCVCFTLSSSSVSNMSDPFYVLDRIEKSHKPVHIYGKKNINNSSVRKKAKDLLNKEKMNTTKSRLECLLIQQFQGKYGSRQPNSQLNNLIKNTVHKFVQSHDDVSSNQSLLNSLENQISEQTEQYKGDVMKRNEQSARVQETLQLSNRRKNSSVQSLGEGGGEGCSPPAEYAIDPHQWAVINAIQAAAVEEAENKKKRLAESKKMRFRHQLDEQLSQVEARKLLLAEEKRRTRMETEQ